MSIKSILIALGDWMARTARRAYQKVKVKFHPTPDTGGSGGGSQTPDDTTPNAFAFTDVTDVDLSALQTSNAVTISGINATVTASVSNGEMQRNGGSWTTSDVSVQVGDSLAVRHTSSGLYSTQVSTTLTVGGVSDTFTSQTLAAPSSSAGQASGLLLAITKAA